MGVSPGYANCSRRLLDLKKIWKAGVMQLILRKRAQEGCEERKQLNAPNIN